MAKTPDKIPVINIASFLDGTDKERVATEVADACKNIGFLIISGHGVKPKVIQNAFDKSKQFFDLPQSEKNKYHPNGPSEQRGYHAFATRGLAYTLGDNAPPDLRETYFLGPLEDHREHFKKIYGAEKAYAANIFPETPKGASEALREMYTSYQRLSEDILRIFAYALGQNESFFSNLIKRHFSILSSHHYPPLSIQPERGQLRTGAHTDFGAITILAMTKASEGLEVLMPNDRWRPVTPIKGELVVNLGDMMSQWTNGNWKSTLHRVVNPPKLNDKMSHRQTIGYFMHPNYDAIIETIQTCIPKNQKSSFEPISAGEHIAKKIKASHEGSN